MPRLTLGALVALVVVLSPAGAAPKNPTVEIAFAGKDRVLVELYQKEAPQTVAHMLDLCKKRFYDGILVHRVEPGFVVQAGDPQTKTKGVRAPGIGSGGSGKNIPFETNSRTHQVGTMAMALSAPRSATGDSQWFINLEANHQLDGDYCVFGKVIKGMDVVRGIKVGDKIVSMRVVTSTTGATKPPKASSKPK